MSEPPKRASDEPLYEVFGVFRDHAVDVSEGFQGRVRDRLETMGHDDGEHRMGDVITGLFNVFGVDPEDPTDADE